MGMKLVVVVVVDICRVDASNWGYGRISCVGGVMVVCSSNRCDGGSCRI